MRCDASFVGRCDGSRGNLIIPELGFFLLVCGRDDRE